MEKNTIKAEQTTTNKLRHTITTTDKDGNYLIIRISLDDECKNGHADFSITATAYEKSKPKTDRYYLYGGCAHDDILAVRPDLKQFVDLHLSDQNGVPMYAIENGFYHANDDSKTKKQRIDTTQEYMRVNKQEAEQLIQAVDSLQFAIMVNDMKLPERWKAEAIEATRQLEEWTGNKFYNEITRGQNVEVSKENREEYENRVKEGYYTEEGVKARQQTQRQKERDDIVTEWESKRALEAEEFRVQMELFDAGVNRFDNWILYTHNKCLTFNWNKDGYRAKIWTSQEVDNIMKSVRLPEGWTVVIK